MAPGVLSGQLWHGTSKEGVGAKTDGKRRGMSDLHPREAWGPQPTAGWRITVSARILFNLEPEGRVCFHK